MPLISCGQGFEALAEPIAIQQDRGVDSVPRHAIATGGAAEPG